MTQRPLPAGVTAPSPGTVVVSGPALEWLQRLDETVAVAARGWGAVEQASPSVIDAADLDRVDYFRSFPHLLTVPVSLPADEVAIARFVDRCDGADGVVPITEHAPVRHALLPAACYPVYPRLAGADLAAAALVTTRAGCFRREDRFVPLRRQWAFTMREIVCVGDDEEVTALLDRGRLLVDELCRALDLRQDWAAATDPFFRPSRQGRYLYQRLHPVKHEAVVDDLAVASVNRHHEHFGDAFAIRRGGGPARSGCVAFGLERWLGVAAARWGGDPASWPDPRAAVADRV